MKNKIFFALIILVWGALIILNFIVPNQTFSEQENRVLKTWPSFSWEKLVSGKYAEELDSYINDHFIFRNTWLKIESFVDIVLGKKENNNVYIGKDGYLFEKFNVTNNNLNNISIAADRINNFANKVQIPVYYMLIPNSIYINQDKLPDNVEVYNQELLIDNMYKNMPYTKNINVANILKQNKDKYIFFKTDHHMTSDGAYLVYKEFCNSANIIPKSLGEFKEVEVSNEFLGTFDSKAQIINQETDTIKIYNNDINTNLEEVIYDNETTKSIYNEDYLNKKDKYSFFLNGNNAKVVVKTKVKNNKKLLVIKDSYAHIMAQFLCQNYEEIHFIDPRYYNLPLSNYVQENEITEALVLYNVSNIITDVGIRNVR